MGTLKRSLLLLRSAIVRSPLFTIVSPCSPHHLVFGIDCTSTQRCKAAAMLLTLSRQLPWLALMLRAAAARPIFWHHSQHLQLQAQLRIRLFHSAHEPTVWLRCAERSGDCRSTCRGQRLQLLCFVQFGIVAARACLSSSGLSAPLCCFIIRRCLSTRGADRLLRYL